MARSITLKYKMILGGMLAVFIPFLIAGIVIYVQLSKSLLEMTEEKLISISRDISSMIDVTLKQEMSLASSISADPDIIEACNTGDYRIAQAELEAIHKKIGSAYFTIFLLDKNGIAKADPVFSQQIGLDLSDREYFKKAKEGKPSVAGPVLARGTATPDAPIIIVSVPIMSANEFLGVIALAFNTDFIADLLARRKLGRTGYAYLINSEGLILVHPRKEFMLKLRLLDLPETEEIGKIILTKKAATAFYSFEGHKKIVGITQVGLTGWIAAFTQNEDEIFTPMNRVLSTILICGLAFMTITTLIIVFFSGRISDPVQKLMEMMKQVTQNSTEMILQRGLDKKVVYANPAFEKITGYKIEEIIGTELKFGKLNRDQEAALWNSLEAGMPWYGHIEITKNSDPITLDVMIVPLRDGRGGVQGYLEIGRDITPELMFEKRLQQTQKLEAIGTLAGGIAHDFNNILSGIFGYAELSLMSMDSDAETQRYIRQIIAASERARELVSQILTFSRKTEVELRPMRPKHVLMEALKLLRASIPATIEIQTTLTSDSVIMAEPTQLHQVVMNLFTNAVHAIGENTGTIKLELENFIVDDEFTKTHPNIEPGKHVLLRISDTGKGMEREVLDHIFEPFFTTKAHGQGTGLGLSVVHGIINKLGGIITVYSEVGQGTAFNIFLPCIEPTDLTIEQNEVSISGGSARVLIVDDEWAITDTMESMLSSLGYTVQAFTDSVDALAAIMSNPNDFDIIITDYSMPKITGLEIAKRLKEADINIPVMLISGYLGEHVEDTARNLGISRILTKPISIYHLTDAIHEVLSGKNS